jgi:pimeloyl-ACP methyl ester carboxylesterase
MTKTINFDNPARMLSHEIIQTQDSCSKTAIMLHGILGSKRNLSGFARKVVAAFPHWRIVLMDLRNHGASVGFSGPHDLQACARDILELAQSLELQVDSLIGHSFGGKVALACSEIMAPKQVWVLDANPGKTFLNAISKSSVLDVIEVLKGVKLPLASRKALVEQLTERGISKAIASWMTTNVKEVEVGLVWNFDLKAVEEMLGFYAQASFWPMLNAATGQIRYDFVRALSEDRFGAEDLDLFAKAASHGSVHLHGLEKSGHWVHIDNPDGLLDIMSPSFI